MWQGKTVDEFVQATIVWLAFFYGTTCFLFECSKQTATDQMLCKQKWCTKLMQLESLLFHMSKLNMLICQTMRLCLEGWTFKPGGCLCCECIQPVSVMWYCTVCNVKPFWLYKSCTIQACWYFVTSSLSSQLASFAWHADFQAIWLFCLTASNSSHLASCAWLVHSLLWLHWLLHMFKPCDYTCIMYQAKCCMVKWRHKRLQYPQHPFKYQHGTLHTMFSQVRNINWVYSFGSKSLRYVKRLFKLKEVSKRHVSPGLNFIFHVYIYYMYIATLFLCFDWKPWKELQSLEDWRGSEETTLTSVPVLFLQWFKTFRSMAYLTYIQGSTSKRQGISNSKRWLHMDPSSPKLQWSTKMALRSNWCL